MAQTPPPAASLSPAEEAAAVSLLEALNQDASRRTRWLAAHAAGSRPAGEMERMMAALAPSQGELKLIGVERRRTLVRLNLETPQGRRARIDLNLSQKEPGRFESLNPIVLPTPYPQKAARRR